MPIGMLAYNTSEHSITKRTPFLANKGFKADILLRTLKCEESVLYIIIKVNKIHRLQNKLRLNLIFFNRVIKKFTNKKEFKDQLLKKEIKCTFYKEH